MFLCCCLGSVSHSWKAVMRREHVLMVGEEICAWPTEGKSLLLPIIPKDGSLDQTVQM